MNKQNLLVGFLLLFIVFNLSAQQPNSGFMIPSQQQQQGNRPNNAQGNVRPTARGNFAIGTRLGFSTAKSELDVSGTGANFKGDGGRAYQINLSPEIGYFLARNFAVGIGMDYIANGSEPGARDTFASESENSNLLFGPFIRVFLPVGESSAFFLGVSLSFGQSKDRFVESGRTQTIDNNLRTLGIGPGFTIFSRRGLALETLVKYNYARSKSEIDLLGVKQNSKTITNAIDFSVGIQYYFGGVRRAASSY